MGKNKVHNFTNVALPDQILQILELGTKTILGRISGRHSAKELKQQAAQLKTNIRWNYIFKDSPPTMAPKLYKKSGLNPQPQAELEQVEQAIDDFVNNKIARLTKTKTPSSNPAIQVAQWLKSHDDLMLVEADKNLGLVILYKQDYYKEEIRQLGNDKIYTRYNLSNKGNILEETKRIALEAIDQLTLVNPIRTDLVNYLIRNRKSWFKEDKQLPKFRLNPKIHKKPWAGRPIVGAYDTYITPLAQVWNL